MEWLGRFSTEKAKKTIFAHIFDRYFGPFIEEKITTDQLNIELLNGRATVERVGLDVQALNKFIGKLNLPLELVDGYVDSIQITIPWTSMLRDSTIVEITGLKLTLQPTQQDDLDPTMFESMWSSMSNSFRYPEDYAKQDSEGTTYEAVEYFAGVIDNILRKIEVKFINTTIQIEHVPKDSIRGVGIIIGISLVMYNDDTKGDEHKEDAPDIDKTKKANVVQTFTTKHINIEGISISTLEFPSKSRTFSRSMMSNSSEESPNTSVNNADEESDVSFASANSSFLNDESQRHEILIARLPNKQLIKVHIKETEDTTAPNISIEVNLGSLVLFLSPRQVHIFLELVSGLSSPDLEDHSNVPDKSRIIEKPMTAVDYQRVEHELQQQIQMASPYLQGGLQGTQGWSGPPLDEDGQETFLPMGHCSTPLCDSYLSGFSGSLDSSHCSTAPSTAFSEYTGHSRRRSIKGHRTEIDPTAEASHFSIQIASLALILLHEDLLTLNPDEMAFVPSSVAQMQQTANKFFEDLESSVFSIRAWDDLDKVAALFSKISPLNHVRVMAVPVHLEVKDKRTMSSFSVTANLDTSKLEIQEYLRDSDSEELIVTPILKFKESTSVSSPFNINVKHVDKTVRSSRRNECTKTDINVNLGECTFDLDFTIIDRIAALLNSPPVCTVDKTECSSNRWANETIVIDFKSKDHLRDMKISSRCINLKLRFPIPDFRPPHDLNRIPWWKKHIRPDHLLFRCCDAVFEKSFNSKQIDDDYSFRCGSADIFYSETEKSIPLQIVSIVSDETCSNDTREILQQIGIKLRISPIAKQLDLEEPEDSTTQSMFNPPLFMKCDNGPFTSKRVVHESNTPHHKVPDEEEELLVPGEKEEVDEFMRVSSESTKTYIGVTATCVKIHLPAKHVYEMIYNRIVNDLLLWQPCAPKTKLQTTQYYENLHKTIHECQDIFTACKSGVQYESGSESEDVSEGEGAILFYSTYERPKSTASKVHITRQSVKQSNLIFKLQLKHGTFSCSTPVRDSGTNNVRPGHVGDVLMNFEDAIVFFVDGYKGNEELGYVSVQVGRTGLYHCDTMPYTKRKSLFPKDNQIGQHLHPTIYKSGEKVLAEVRTCSTSRDMLTLACKIETNHETHHAKTIKISLGLNQATLRHRMCLEPNTWISQLMDFFNVTDYPIPGYNAKEVLTELFIHMWDCAIDYRPLYLPLRSVITFGSFSINSHMTETTGTTLLRFIAEECGLFISDKAPPKSGVPSSAPVDLRKDYVNVIFLGLFELSLRITDKHSKSEPHIDLRASNDCIHIYTCSDSARALTQLITYIATDGDLNLNLNSSNTDSAYSSPRHHPVDQELISVEQIQDIRKITEEQHEQVNELLIEAIQEPEEKPENICVHNDDDHPGARLFFFPDEQQTIISNVTTCIPFPQVIAELGDLSLLKDSDSDDDFFFVEDETTVEPEIKWLTNDPLRVSENYFFTLTVKKDVLDPPDNFPMPKYKYNLCEMNCIWHMYGGCDFKSTARRKKIKKPKKENSGGSQTNLRENVSFSSTGGVKFMSQSDPEKKSEQKQCWKSRGGSYRNHKVLMELELNKVRFQYDIYPETAFQASRQALQISELEIRDLLDSSEFNKFMYLYTSSTRPKQTHGHMIIIKAVHIRPDKNLDTEECCLRVSVLPLRFNIDQDSLNFLITFLSELGETPDEEDDIIMPTSKQNTPTHKPPVMTVSMNKNDKEDGARDGTTEEDLIVLEPNHFDDKPKSPVNPPVVDNSRQPIFFRSVIFGPDVDIKIDYRGKHIEVADGSLASLLIGLVMGLFQLNCSELRLKSLSYRNGLLGTEKLVNFFLQEWLNDIRKNQIKGLVAGVGPFYYLVQLVQGIKDLFWMPIEQYQRDGRIVRGIQRGANSFTRSTARATLELATRLINLIQMTAESAYDMLSPGPSVRRIYKSKGRKKRHHQPQDIREGVTNAYWLVKKGIGETADNIVQAVSLERNGKGYSGAVGGLIRQIPPTVLTPIIIATEATSNVLDGMKCQLIPDARNEANQKWRSKDDDDE